MRAVPMPAGVRNIALLLTVCAFNQHLRAMLAAAISHGRQCFALRGQKTAAVLGNKGFLEGFDDG